MKKLLWQSPVFIIVFLTQSGCLWGYQGSQTKLTVKVVDEQGAPMSGMPVSMGFFIGSEHERVGVDGNTDSEGKFTGSALSYGLAGVSVEQPGYYKSTHDLSFQGPHYGRWQPWNPTVELVLRKIENPVPMYARNTRWFGMEIPVVGEPIGFDLTAYDWVAPHGKGEHSDFIFKLERRVTSWDDYDSTLTLTFSNRFDGIQVHKDYRKLGSDFKLPRFAPENGYEKKRVFRRQNIPGDRFMPAKLTEIFAEDDNYFFRVRSEEKDGKLFRAMYGKIQGGIRFFAPSSEAAKIHFKYYLNPEYTRNMEYNPKRNLFKDLPSRERVTLK